MNRIQTFWCEPSDRAQESLRRYVSSAEGKCGGPYGYHNVEVILGDAANPDERYNGCSRDDIDHADPRWPTHCACGYAFAADDQWQHRYERYYRRVDTGELFPLDKAPAGASYDAHWYHDWMVGPDGVSLVVVLPRGTHWVVDSRANNCTRPDDKVHKCWVRDGDPRACNVTAGKSGDTCSAGAGSIAAPGYHGFLRGGWLEEC